MVLLVCNRLRKGEQTDRCKGGWWVALTIVGREVEKRGNILSYTDACRREAAHRGDVLTHTEGSVPHVQFGADASGSQVGIQTGVVGVVGGQQQRVIAAQQHWPRWRHQVQCAQCAATET